ncbi:MAG: cyclic nucleotide-binding domain-containing protein [Oligoflexales bacterium]|nr:cyclic nucleotide-binding domain-containing protein [Oligoflexales bacterium]
MAISTSETDIGGSREHFSDPSWGGKQLRNISLFDYLSEQELFELYQLGKIHQFAAKSNMVIEGEQSRGLFILLEGKVSVYKTDRNNGNMIRLAYLETGAAFGELSLFDDVPRSATVVAESSCYVFSLEEGPFNSYLDGRGDQLKARFYKKCAEEMVSRFRQQNSDYIISQKLLWAYALRKDEEQKK